MTTKPRTMAEINERLGEIGRELAKGRLYPVRNHQELEAEQEALRAEYYQAMDRESREALERQKAAE
jgi:hypothetical protein